MEKFSGCYGNMVWKGWSNGESQERLFVGHDRDAKLLAWSRISRGRWEGEGALDSCHI